MTRPRQPYAVLLAALALAAASCGSAEDGDLASEAVALTDACYEGCLERGGTDERCAEGCASIGGTGCYEGCLERGGTDERCRAACDGGRGAHCYARCEAAGLDVLTCREACGDRMADHEERACVDGDQAERDGAGYACVDGAWVATL